MHIDPNDYNYTYGNSYAAAHRNRIEPSGSGSDVYEFPVFGKTIVIYHDKYYRYDDGTSNNPYTRHGCEETLVHEVRIGDGITTVVITSLTELDFKNNNIVRKIDEWLTDKRYKVSLTSYFREKVNLYDMFGKKYCDSGIITHIFEHNGHRLYCVNNNTIYTENVDFLQLNDTYFIKDNKLHTIDDMLNVIPVDSREECKNVLVALSKLGKDYIDDNVQKFWWLGSDYYGSDVSEGNESQS